MENILSKLKVCTGEYVRQTEPSNQQGFKEGFLEDIISEVLEDK